MSTPALEVETTGGSGRQLRGKGTRVHDASLRRTRRGGVAKARSRLRTCIRSGGWRALCPPPVLFPISRKPPPSCR
jgi:hypothetical protein